MGGRQVNKAQMNKPLESPPEGKQDNPLAKFFQGKKEPYVSITKSIKDCGVENYIMDITLPNDNKEECIVIPVRDLIYKEWRIMSGSEIVSQPQNERTQDGSEQAVGDGGPHYNESSPEVG